MPQELPGYWVMLLRSDPDRWYWGTFYTGGPILWAALLLQLVSLLLIGWGVRGRQRSSLTLAGAFGFVGGALGGGGSVFHHVRGSEIAGHFKTPIPSELYDDVSDAMMITAGPPLLLGCLLMLIAAIVAGNQTPGEE